MKTTHALFVACLVVAPHALVHAEGSLIESRQAIIKGTAPGIVIWDGGRSPQAPAATASSAAATGATGAGTPKPGQKAEAPAAAASSVPLVNRLGGLFKWGAPPSGQPLSSARRLDSPTLGIPLPTQASAASQPAGKEPPK